MAKSQIQALADDASEFYQRLGILNQDPDDAAIQLLGLPTEQAKRILESIHPSDHREKIYTNLVLLSQRIQALL